MKDTVAEVVAARIVDTIAELERHGLRRFSILNGVEIGLQQARAADAALAATAPAGTA